MAISASKMRPLVQADLEKMIQDIETELSTTWAVYADFMHDTGTYKVVKVVPWSERTYDAPIHKVQNAVDEMDAYKKFMEQVDKALSWLF